MRRKISIILMALMLMTTTAFAAGSIYVVKSGDTMWAIAAKNNVTIKDILVANPNITNANTIYPGQKINIPVTSTAAMENEVIRLVNVQRAKAGLMALKGNANLSNVARIKSQNMANLNYFSHYSPTYGSPFDMMKAYGFKFSAAGENIAMGQKTPADVMNAWMNSPGHRSNILSPAYTEIGVGFAKNKNGVQYWTQMFMKPAY